jgi:hypothetical protein
MTPDKLFHVCDLVPALLSAFSIGVVVGGLTALCKRGALHCDLLDQARHAQSDRKVIIELWAFKRNSLCSMYQGQDGRKSRHSASGKGFCRARLMN